MRTIVYIDYKYWIKHKKSLAALLFSGVLLCAVVCCAFLTLRQSFNRWLNNYYDTYGYYSYITNSNNSDEIDMLSTDETVKGYMYVYGRIGVGDSKYTYGELDDKYDLAHIPLKSGKLPEQENEIAIDESVLKEWGYFGKTGEEIILGSKKYSLVGIISEGYGKNRAMSELYDDEYHFSDITSGDKNEKLPIPLIFVKDKKEKALYSFSMLDKIKPLSYDEYMVLANDTSNNLSVDDIAVNIIYKNKSEDARSAFNTWNFNDDKRKTLILTYIAAAIAGLSVIAVMRNIFSEREASLSMLRKIGLSKRSIRIIFVMECSVFSIIQGIIGILLGMLTHIFISLFQIKRLEMTPYLGLTLDKNVTDNTASPFIYAFFFSLLILALGYISSALLSHIKKSSHKRKNASSLGTCISRAFQTRAVTVIQIMALTLICFGTVFGYMIYHNSKGMYDNETGEFMPYNTTEFGKDDMFDFETDGVEEYYKAQKAGNIQLADIPYVMRSNIQTGIGDADADKLNNTIVTGELSQTFLMLNEKRQFSTEISFNPEQRQYITEYSTVNVEDLFDKGKHIYSCTTKLSNINVLNELKDYVVSGKIDINKINSGEQVIVVCKNKNDISLGEEISIGSAMTESGLGIDELDLSRTKVGAVIILPPKIERVLKYAVSDNNMNILTTVTGAEKLKLHNASYTELFAYKHLESSLIPMGAGFECDSYTVRTHNKLISDISQFSSMALIVFLMSLLGFSAYFNGIGMKIRLKEYQISVLRAIGTPLKRLKSKLIIQSLKIPFTASAIAFMIIKMLQKAMMSAYQKTEKLYVNIDELYEQYDKLGTENFELMSNKINNEIMMLKHKFLLDNQMWYINALIPTIIIFSVMCIITVLITRQSCKMFTPDIASSLAKGRKRQ